MTRSSLELPSQLQPTGIEKLELPSGAISMVSKATPRFREWRGPRIEGPFASKPHIEAGGAPVFAEVAILQALEAEGWSGRWVQTYGAKRLEPYLLRNWTAGRSISEQPQLPIESADAAALLDRIAGLMGRFGGCWDVFAWRNGTYLFAEAKHSKKDKIRETQLHWLAAALECGLSEQNFLLVEWSFMPGGTEASLGE